MSGNFGEGKGAGDMPLDEAGVNDDGRKKSDVHITWDEQTIAEHDKLRGTRQKIDEPSTPFHYGSGESSQGSDCESSDGKGFSSISPGTGSPHGRASRSNSVTSSNGDKRGSILKVMADVSAALPDESALRKERQARWDSDVSEGSVATEDKEKARKFKQHREAHYNEFKALQEWRDKRSGDMMDDDSDSEDVYGGAVAEERRRRVRPGGASSLSAPAAAGHAEEKAGAPVDEDKMDDDDNDAER